MVVRMNKGDAIIRDRPRLVPSSPSYTLAELRSSMEEFLTDMKTRGHATVFGADSLTDWKFETYLQWLAKREQGKE